MARGDKSKYSDKQERQAEHIEKGYEAKGVPEGEAERRAWATVNKTYGGGNAGGSGVGDQATLKSGPTARKSGQAARTAATTKKPSGGARKRASATKARTAATSKSSGTAKTKRTGTTTAKAAQKKTAKRTTAVKKAVARTGAPAKAKAAKAPARRSAPKKAAPRASASSASP